MVDPRGVVAGWLFMRRTRNLVNSPINDADELLAILADAGLEVVPRIDIERATPIVEESNQLAQENLAELKRIKSVLHTIAGMAPPDDQD